jgi:hypothetical protein
MYKGISLHIGVSRLSTDVYRSAAALFSPENDAKAMAELAKHEGYSKIRLFTDEEATLLNFKNCFSECAESLTSGDTFLLTFSGHGGQRADSNGDESDALDETWCFYDGYFLDDDIGAMWKQFKEGVRIIVVSASCHSRSALKPYPVSLPFWKTKANTHTTPVIYSYPDDPEILASILHLSACDDRQQARDGEQFSIFTELLLKTWDEGRFTGTYEQLIRSINSEAGYLQTGGLALLGKTNPDFINTTPFKLLTNKT